MGNLNLGALRNKSGEKNKEKRLTITGKGNKKEKGERKKTEKETETTLRFASGLEGRQFDDLNPI